MKNLLISDVVSALKMNDQWLFLGWHDIRSKYRRTTLGPLWIIIVNLITIICFSIVGAALFKQSVSNFLPHVAIGMFVWAYIASIISEACTVFFTQANLIQNLNTNLLTICLRLFIKNTIIFLHSFVLIIFILLIFGEKVTPMIMLTFLAFPFFCITAFSIAILLGFVSARFRDIALIVQSLMTIIPYVTPIIWKTEMLGEYSYIAYLNPITYYIALFRDPLLGNEISISTYAIVSVISLTLFMGSMYIYNKFKNRLVFWL